MKTCSDNKTLLPPSPQKKATTREMATPKVSQYLDFLVPKTRDKQKTVKKKDKY